MRLVLLAAPPGCGGEGGTQTVDFDNTIVNGKLVTYEPQHGISVLVERTAGTVRVKEPGSKKGFQNFKKVESVRVNSLVDPPLRLLHPSFVVRAAKVNLRRRKRPQSATVASATSR